VNTKKKPAKCQVILVECFEQEKRPTGKAAIATIFEICLALKRKFLLLRKNSFLTHGYQGYPVIAITGCWRKVIFKTPAAWENKPQAAKQACT
jgi:hypothetical protein